MRNAPMRFCGCEFDHNPKNIEIRQARNVKELPLINGKSRLQDTGHTAKTVTGLLELCGDGCIRQYKELLSKLLQGKSGLLSIAGYDPFYARFVSLEMTQPPADGFISCRFVFQEDLPEQRENMPASGFYTMGQDETLWDVAHRFSVPIAKLLQKNPWISRPDSLSTGEKVALP